MTENTGGKDKIPLTRIGTEVTRWEESIIQQYINDSRERKGKTKPKVKKKKVHLEGISAEASRGGGHKYKNCIRDNRESQGKNNNREQKR